MAQTDAERGEGPVVQGRPVGQPVGAQYHVAAAPQVVVVGTLPPEEQIILNYRMAVMCFAGLDLISTTLYVLTAWFLDDRFKAWELLLLVFVLGPLFGFLGAKKLKRRLVAAYVGFCVCKVSFQIATALFTMWLWGIIFAIIQFWILKIVMTFWMALGVASQVANEVAAGEFCEATLGIKDKKYQALLCKLFDCRTFRVTATDDIPGVELCGALKNVVALGAGFCDGLEYGGNTKAALIRIGLQEMKTFIRYFYPEVKDSTFLESCGVADLITTCFGGRNRKCAEAFVKAKGAKSWAQIEKELLGGQKLQGTLTALEIWPVMQKHNLCEKLPLLTTVYQIAFEDRAPWSIVKLPSGMPSSAFHKDDGFFEEK
ncbi:unnamed protein product [Effrenium voratum]|nr:unnamed protein product [Effrenium voratum]